MDFFFKLIYFSVINLRDKKKRRGGNFSSFWSVFAQEIFIIKALIIYTANNTSWLSHGHSENAEGTDQMGGDTAPHFDGTDLILFVLAVVTTVIAGGAGRGVGWDRCKGISYSSSA